MLKLNKQCNHEVCIKLTLSMTERQIEKPGNIHRRDTLKGSYNYEVLSSLVQGL